jgi:hypothetical protein
MSKNKKHIIFCLSLLVVLVVQKSVVAQQLNYTLNRDYLWGYDQYFNNKEESFQTFVKPYRYEQLNNAKDSAIAFPAFPLGQKIKTRLHEKFPSSDSNKFKLIVLPLPTLVWGYQHKPSYTDVSDLAIGGTIMADIGNKLSLNFKVLGGEGVSNFLADSVIHTFGVVPGLGEYRSDTKHLRRYSYQYYSGYLSYSPNKNFNFQAGQDKHFWGDGYRSLFLSDVSAPYPFFKITTNIWKLTYVNLYTIMQGTQSPSRGKQDWFNKYATFHYLGYNITKRINIGVFESVIWQGSDKNRMRGYDVNYLNPVIFFRPVEFSLGSSDNSFMGFSYKIKLFKKQQLYGQLLLDEFHLKDVVKRTGWWGNKYGIQTGFKSFDLFRIKRLNFQTEWNYVRPYTYSHGSVLQSYSNLNQPLAHPLGANFIELASFLNYRYKRFFFEGKCVYAVYGADTATSDYGRNIFIPYTQHPYEYGNTTTQGVKTNLVNLSIRGAYIVAPKINFKIELGVEYRIEQNELSTYKIPYVYLGLRTDLCNMYNDY